MRLSWLLVFFSWSLIAQVLPAIPDNPASTQAVAALATPALIQHISFSATSNSIFLNGGNLGASKIIRYPFVNLTQAGNTLVLFVSGFGSASSTISGVGDDQGQTWTQATYGANSTARRYVWAFVMTNCAANVHLVWVTNGSVVLTNQVATLTEFKNVAPFNPVDATNTASGSQTGTLTGGSITPTQTGDMLLHFVARSGPSATDGNAIPAKLFTAGSQGSITWALQSADLWDGHALQSGVYSSVSAINPQMTVSTNANQYISATIALKASSGNQGNSRPAGIYIARLLHQSYPGTIQTLTNYWQFPCEGNLLIQASQAGQLGYPTNTVDNIGNQWTLSAGHPVIGSGNSANTCCLFASNATASSTFILTNKLKGNGDQTIMFYDVVGASAFPYDYGVTNIGTIGPDNLGSVGNGQFDFTHWFTPAGSGELVIGQTQQAQNTQTNSTGPSGILFDAMTWDTSNVNGPQNGDENNGWCHYLSTGAGVSSSVRWNTQFSGVDPGDWTAYIIGFGAAGFTPTASPKMFIQATNHALASGHTNSFAFVNQVNAGSLIVVGVQTVSGRTYACYDSQGHTYLMAALSGPDAGATPQVAVVFYTTNVSAGALTVKVAVSGANCVINAIAHEYAGFALFNPLDQTATNVTSSTTSWTTGNTSTTAFANELLFCYFEDGGGSGGYNPGSGFTTGISTSSQGYTEDNFVNSTGAYAGTFTTVNGDYGAAILCTFH